MKEMTNTTYLPSDINFIILTMLKIRKATFANSPVRYEDDYIPWYNMSEEQPSNQLPEHSTQCYPSLPLLRFPKKYRVNRQVDSDYCDKSFNSHSNFSNGIFSVGCSCQYNITFGFELMLERESAHNMFRFLMCRDIDLYSLKGVLYDFSCGLDPYLLNRDPREFEYKRILVDGAHWASQKQLKKPNQTGRGGHLGCSDSYNFNLYKKYLNNEANINSQGREQMHAIVDACCKSLRQFSYSNYMTFLYVFFAVTNLKNRGMN